MTQIDVASIPIDRVLVIVAHPDDIEFSCSGTIARWVKAGAEVCYVLVTSGDVGIIDAAEGKVTGTIELGGAPESAVSDGAGHVFVNCEDTAEVLKLDAREMKVLDRWSR